MSSNQPGMPVVKRHCTAATPAQPAGQLPRQKFSTYACIVASVRAGPRIHAALIGANSVVCLLSGSAALETPSTACRTANTAAWQGLQHACMHTCMYAGMRAGVRVHTSSNCVLAAQAEVC